VPALVTQNFRIHNSRQFFEMFDEGALIGGTATSNTAVSTAFSTNAYLFIGKSDSWSGSFSDTSIPDPSTNTSPSSDSTSNTSYSHWQDMIAAKKVGSADVSHVVTRHNWTTGQHYSMFKDTGVLSELLSTRTSQTLANTSGTGTATASLYPMYVMNTNFNVYKCLYNAEVEISGTNYPQVSTVEPTAVSTDAGAPAALADGYIWKYMYSISASDALKFVTSSYIPVKQLRDANAYGNTGSAGGLGTSGAKNDGSDQATIEFNTVDGALDVFVVNTDGTGYHFENNLTITNSSESVTLTMANPTLTTADYYNNSSIYFTFSGASYVRKITDMSYSSPNATLTLDATVPALSGTITANVAPFAKINGDGHGAEVILTANSSDTDAVGGVTVVSGGNSYTTATLSVEQQGLGTGSSAAITTILPPKGGHGYDPVAELGGFFIMINTKLTQDESGKFTTTNDFRKIGLLTDPNQDAGHTRITDAAVTQAKTFTFTSNTAAITNDITVSQNATGANGATGYVIDVNASASTMTVVNITNGANTSAGYDGKPGSFQCTTSNVASSFTGVSTSIAAITYSGGNAVLTNVANGAMQIGSGKIIYIENRAPVARAADQTEDIKLIIEF